ncbi:nucleotidyl transferase AbiEii/AbiGii toxin family protein [Thermococcus barophilus]|uniref:Nucleotidyl transferase AbiEii/AbiGii toxin family protein n=1 Tax=Thermococcus barophilus (strain DSM 11836 / MP) TaxID=391623 RepID=F0LN92_THEBM|nr:nucleotidyl transferase AbiEii/AbiGii toxin family protein [Thermococcus barophilus]ADT85231.1 hypothetical protein TERMP_02258 [Thermococcus barophilus MP]
MVIDEIKRKSFELGLPISTIEKDYVIGWILYGVWRSGLWKDLAFKGGTCLKKAYFSDYRFSEDLDYTLTGKVSEDKLKERLERMLEFANAGPVEFLGLEFELRYGVRNFEGELLGFEVKIPFRLVRRTGTPSKIKMDITLEKYEKIVLPLQEKELLHEYSDADKFSLVRLKSYSLEEIFTEKVRSLFQRTRPRDLYDVWKLKDIIELETAFSILPEKFRLKNVQFELEIFKERRIYYERAWERSLAHQINPLPEFDKVWNDVLKFLEELKESVKL